MQQRNDSSTDLEARCVAALLTNGAKEMPFVPPPQVFSDGFLAVVVRHAHELHSTKQEITVASIHERMGGQLHTLDDLYKVQNTYVSGESPLTLRDVLFARYRQRTLHRLGASVTRAADGGGTAADLDAVARQLEELKDPSTTVQRKGASFPRGVWTGTMGALNALQLPEQQIVGTVGPIGLRNGETMLMYGPPSVSKTLFAFRTALDVVMRGGRVLLVEGEGSQRSLRERLIRIANGLRPTGLTAEELERVHITHGGFGLQEEREAWQQLLDGIRPSLVIVDPLVSYFRGDENSAPDISMFLRHVDMARDIGASVVVLHHANKGDQEGRFKERGSSALRAWADHMVALTPNEDGSLVISHEKNREGAKQMPQTMRWVFDQTTITLADEGQLSESAASADLTRRLLKLLDVVDEMTVTEAKLKLKADGKRWGRVLKMLVDDGRVEEFQAPRKRSDGQNFTAKLLRLRAGIPSGPGSQDSAPESHDPSPATPTAEEQETIPF